MKYSIIISAIFLFFCSCGSSNKEELTAFRQTLNSLERSNKTIMLASEDVRKKISGKVSHIGYLSRELAWYSKAIRFSKLSTSVIEYINQLKSLLIEQSGKDVDHVFASGNLKSVERIFVKQNKGKELYNVLKGFIDSTRKIDWELDSATSDKLIEEYDYLDSSINGSKEFTKTFDGISAASALSLLAKFENDIRNTEYQLVTYCDIMSSPVCILQYERFQAIVGQSSSCVKAGNDIQITAGIGSFSLEAQPTFSVDGKAIKSDVDGVMIYKFKTPLKAGDYFKPVKIEYTKPDGTRESKEYNIEYSVIDPK